MELSLLKVCSCSHCMRYVQIYSMLKQKKNFYRSNLLGLYIQPTKFCRRKTQRAGRTSTFLHSQLEP